MFTALRTRRFASARSASQPSTARAAVARTAVVGVALAGGVLAGTAPAASAGASAAAIDPTPGAFYQVVSGTGLRLEVVNGSTAAYEPVVQGSGTGATYRPSHWQFQAVGSYYRVINRHSNMCLDVRGADLNDNVPLRQGPCGSQFSQQWTLTETDPGFFSMTARHSNKPAGVFANLRYSGAPIVQDAVGGTTGEWKQWRISRVS